MWERKRIRSLALSSEITGNLGYGEEKKVYVLNSEYGISRGQADATQYVCVINNNTTNISSRMVVKCTIYDVPSWHCTICLIINGTRL